MMDLFAASAAIMMSGKKAVIKSLTVTENGEYNAADYGCDGFDPVLVNVPVVIQSITITKNGTYTAPAGVDGYSPVIVNSPYETLYKIEHGLTETIDTGVPDPDGNDIVIDGLPVDGLGDVNNLMDIEFKDGEGNLSFVLADTENTMNVIRVEISVTKTDIYIPSLTVTNMKTGQSKTISRDALPSSYYLFNPNVTNYGNIIRFNTSYSAGSGTPYGIELGIPLSDIGITYIDWAKSQWYISDPSSILN